MDNYKSVFVREMYSAWDRAQESLRKAQKRQKQYYDRFKNSSKFSVGEPVFLFMPARKTGHLRKLACPFEGPYRVIGVYPSGLDLQLIYKPNCQPIRVALHRVRRCPAEIGGRSVEAKQSSSSGEATEAVSESERNEAGQGPENVENCYPRDKVNGTSDEAPEGGVWKGRLRSRD